MARLVRLGWLSVALIAATPLLPHAQDEAAQQPTFRTRIDSVSIDVSVTDRDGNPVLDLTPEDFEIREGGRVQTIDTFKLVQTEPRPGDPVPTRDILSMADHQREGADEANRLFVIFLDDYHTRFPNSLVIRQRLATFVSGLSPRDLVAIATPLAPLSASTFSRNHAVTAAVLREFVGRKYDYTPKHPLEQRYNGETPEVQEQFRNDMVIAAMRTLCDYLGSLRDGRKTVLFVSEGLLATLPRGVRVRNSDAPGNTGRTVSNPSESRAFFEQSSLYGNLDRVFQAASRSNTAVYTLDPRGLSSSEFAIDDNVGIAQGMSSLDDATDVLRVLSDETDGRAIVGKNDPLPALQQMVRDSSTYYLLSYTSTQAPRDGKFHEFDVRVRRRGLTVRARKGYWAASAETVERAARAAVSRPPADVVSAIDELGVNVETTRGRAINVWMGAARGTAGDTARLTFAWEAAPGAPPTGSDAAARVRLTANTATGDQVFDGDVPSAPAAGRTGGQIEIDVPAGRVNARVVVENANGIRIESNDLSFDVPDFSGAGPQVSTLTMFRGRTARDIQMLRAAEHPLPVVVRNFSRAERLLLRFSAYGPADATPVVSMKLLNRSGAPIATLPEPTRSAGGPLELEMALGAFPPGDYLIEVTAESGGASTKRLIGIRLTS